MDARPVSRNKAGQFVKGQSGNPSGRVKDTEEMKAVKEIMNAGSPKAAQTLVELLDSDKEMMRFYAAQEILNRTLGKPVQSQEINVSGNLDVRGQVRALLQERINHERRRASESDRE